jgi:hypothetical protein
METKQGISLCSYLYLKLAKMPHFLIFYVSSTKSENKSVEQVLPGDRVWGENGEGAQIMYIYIYTCN